MRCSRCALVLLITVILCSIYLAKVSNIIEGPSGAGEAQFPDPDGSFGTNREHLMLFVQVSDIHVSIFSDPDRLTEFADLLRHLGKIIKPAVVVASGDLTDARDSTTRIGSIQHEQEWTIYSNLLKDSGILNTTRWLDIRGNHDTFNVASNNDYFKSHSIQGAVHSRSYFHEVEVSGDRYNFFAVDATLDPGPKRPFNFIGELPQHEVNHIRELFRQSTAKYVIFFGHYPTSCILTPNADTDVRSLLGSHRPGLVYLCGHLHNFGGLVPKMYGLHRAGFLELEVGDWKLSRMYRLAAVDHGLFSFVDLRYNEFPIILITNPKSSDIRIPDREDPLIALRSTHIRILAFSSAEIVECRVQIDEEGGRPCTETAKDLFTVPWDPQFYRRGSHAIRVFIKDDLGRRKTIVQPFSFDGSDNQNFGLMARFSLMTDFTMIFHALFAAAFLLCFLPLFTFRIWHSVTVRYGRKRPVIKWNWLNSLVRKFWLLSSVDRLFYPLIAFYLYILAGPWMIGEVIDGHMGYVFLWGIFVKGAFMQGTLTYLYGFFQLLLCQFPLTLVYASMVDYKFRQTFSGLSSKRTRFQLLWPKVPFFLIITVEIILGIAYVLSYGAVAFVLGPLRIWSVVLHIVLFYQVGHLQPNVLRSGGQVWMSEVRSAAD